MKKIITQLSLLFLLMGTMPATINAADNVLKSIDYSTLPGEQMEFVFTLENEASEPLAFTIDDPARIAFDLPDTDNGLAQKSQRIGVGSVRSVNSAQGRGRTRIVINLSELVPFQTETRGNQIRVTLQSPGTDPFGVAASKPIISPAKTTTENSTQLLSGKRIKSIDFRRGDKGEGRIFIDLSSAKIVSDIRENGKKIVIDFLDTALPEDLQRRLDVIDFGTPVSMIDTVQDGANTKMTIIASGEYEHLAYQSNDQFILEVKPRTKEEIAKIRKDRFGYTGEKLSLNFQDIEVRSILQLLADFTGLNMVVSDTVTGNLTLRLQNVPWDQALDIILKTKGLAKRTSGNVILVAPTAELAAQEKQELESQQQVVELAPLHSEFIRVNYAKAADIASLLNQKNNSLLSGRGSVTVDERTNTILVSDTDESLEDVRRLLKKLDIPVRQVLIESRIVIATDDFSKELGIRFGVFSDSLGDSSVAGTGNGAIISGNLNATTARLNGEAIAGLDRLNVNLPSASSAGTFALALATLPNSTLLELEISAAQNEGRGEVVSSPRVITANQNQATIEQGVEIPYQEASSSGASTTSFKKAVLSLKVTPQITPDDRVVMDLEVNKDSVGQIFSGIPSIDTRTVKTQVLVDNGQTVVLGGIYETTTNDAVDKVPFFGDLPILGALFRHSIKVDKKSELLVFITPKILKEQLSLAN
ncbi:MAG: type IV pilus secretin PilQ [Gammaproteobacteria bacterium]|nr:type IV pilus secretin PilQ [Gammaproteobacteria bacterium]